MWPLSEQRSDGRGDIAIHACLPCQSYSRGSYPPDCVEKPGAGIGAGASLIAARRLRPRVCGGWGGWHGDQLGQLAEVLGGGGEEELVSCAVGTSQAQAIHPEDALEAREQHFDLLPLAARDQIGVGRGDIAGDIAGALVDGTQDLARGLHRAAARLESAGVTVELAGAVAQHAVFFDRLAGLL